MNERELPHSDRSRTTMRAALAALAVLVTLAAPVSAATDVQSLVKRMKAGLEPERPSMRKLDFEVGAGTECSRLVVGEARKKVNGASRILLVVLEPEPLRGMAYLVQEGTGDENVQWVYLPAVRRVRALISPEAHTAFLNSDFTYADLGFVRTDADYTLLGEEQHRGMRAYEIQGIPRDTWYGARTVTWVGTDTGLPIERDVYDQANHLWKRERWEDVSVVDGVPTTVHVSMENLPAKTRTDIEVRSVSYDADVPDALFDPAALPSAATSPLWAALGG